MSDRRQSTALPPTNPGAIILPDPYTLERIAQALNVTTVALLAWIAQGCPLPGPAPPPPPPPPPPPGGGDSPPGGPGPDPVKAGDTLFGSAACCPAPANVPDYYAHTDTDTITTGPHGVTGRVWSVVRQAVYYGRGR